MNRSLLLAAAAAAGLYLLTRGKAAMASTTATGHASAAGLPRHTLMVYSKKHLDPGWAKVLRNAGMALNWKVMDGTSALRAADTAAILAEARAAGVPVEGWGYHYLRTPAEAAAEGTAAGLLAVKLGLKAYWCDAEKEWAGTEGAPRTANPEAAALAFIRAFRAAAPNVALVWNSYSYPKTSDGRPLTTDAVLRAVDAWSVQTYGTRRKTVADKTAERAKRAANVGVPFWPLYGTGRRDAQGQQWGWNQDIPHFKKMYQLPRVGHFYGAGSLGMLQTGHAGSPSIVSVVAA